MGITKSALKKRLSEIQSEAEVVRGKLEGLKNEVDEKIGDALEKWLESDAGQAWQSLAETLDMHVSNLADLVEQGDDLD